LRRFTLAGDTPVPPKSGLVSTTAPLRMPPEFPAQIQAPSS